MRTVRPCPSCSAPLTVKMVRCPHCNQLHLRGVFTRGVSWFATLVGGLTLSSTLSACYGAPCAEGDDEPWCKTRDNAPTCNWVSAQPAVDDKDGDGYCLAQDCNENDKTVNASALDIPRDGIDQNCDGMDAR